MAEARRRRRRKRGLGFMRPILYILMLAAMGFGISIFFKVSEVEVQGNNEYSAEEIIAASGVEFGKNLFLVSASDIVDSLFKTMPYLDEVSITRKLPGTLVIHVEETQAVAVVESGGTYYVLNKNCKILDATDAGGAASLIKVGGISPILPVVGQRIALGDAEGVKADFLRELLTLATDMGIIAEISDISLASIADLSFTYQGRFLVKLGGLDKLEYKLGLLRTTVENLAEGDSGTIDLSKDREAHYIPR